MDELERFLQLFLESLQDVEQSYYVTTYMNLSMLRGVLSNRGRFNNDDDFERFAERVFCYELYHQLRNKIDAERRDNANFLENTKLQGEVKKMQVAGLVERLGLERLEKEYIPDFLMHTPGNSDRHPYVIEVKCMPEVTEDEVWTDIQKIDEFVTRYGYERGIFLSANAEFERIRNIITNLTERIEALAGINQIKVICKTTQNAEPIIWGINNGHFQVLE